MDAPRGSCGDVDGGLNVDDVLRLTLRQRGLNFAPGEEWPHSNSGYVLLTELVARAGGMSFADFTRRRLSEPLGMKATTSPADSRAALPISFFPPRRPRPPEARA